MAPTRRNIRRRLTAAARTVFRVVTFVCVCVALWRAPLPWLHHHAESVVQDGDATLERHLDAWHQADATHTSGWHLHLALLDDILRGDGSPVPPQDRNDAAPVIVEHLTPEVSLDSDVGFRMDSLQAPAVLSSTVLTLPPCPSRAVLNRRPGADRTEPRRLLTVLCVARC